MGMDAQSAAAIIKKIEYMTIASVTPDGRPWNSPVFCAYDDNLNFYWKSWVDNQHSKNIMATGRVFIVIYDSTAPEGTGEGVYIEARAEALEIEPDVKKGSDLTYHRSHKTPKEYRQYMGDSIRKVFRATPEKIWINGDGEKNGEYVDIRTELSIDDIRVALKDNV